MDSDKMVEKELVVVGIGASAGGLEALQAFVKKIPYNTNICYVVAQHLSPTYKSLMATLLSKETEHKVIEAKNGLILKPDYIYICPPNKNICIKDETIILKDPIIGTYGPKPSIDILFESIAISKGKNAAGIILSGTGSDGSRGIRAVKAEGGYTIAQDPNSAKYDGMPISAINTGNIDLIMEPKDIAEELPDIFSGSRVVSVVSSNKDGNVVKNILDKLQALKKIDFSQYKINTIQRRIERRMAALKITSITFYNNYLNKNAEEIEALFNDILIGVTSFFRDAEAFESLKKHLTEYVEKKKEKSIRIWAPGCSTGEEAYSIAIMISEILDMDIVNYNVQIFATDIDERATAIARKGLYPESALIDLDKKRRNKFFHPKKDNYEIIKSLREMVIFSRHDIIKDPPFLKLDIIICRNLLIYFNSDLQKNIFPMFHYALNDYGMLFLGKSETVGNFQTHFNSLDKKWKIYNSIFIGKKIPPVTQLYYQSNSYDSIRAKEELKNSIKAPTIQEMMYEKINKYILPTCLVVNEGMDIVFVKGENPYIIYPEGTRTDNVFKNIKSVLSTELRSAIHLLKTEEKTIIKSNFQKVELYGDIIRYVRMIIMTLDTTKNQKLYMICFQEEQDDDLNAYSIDRSYSDNDEKISKLEIELSRTKEHLQTVIEELETNNEEMQSLNEELQSSNEELQSSNEELETTNEELQSTNEELQTAYAELKNTYDEKENRIQEYLYLQKENEKNIIRMNKLFEIKKCGLFEYHIPARSSDYWSESFSLILGYQPGELPMDKAMIENWFREKIHPKDLLMYEKEFENYITGNSKELTITFRFKHKSGEYRLYEIIAKSLERDMENNVTRIIGTITNMMSKEGR